MKKLFTVCLVIVLSAVSLFAAEKDLPEIDTVPVAKTGLRMNKDSEIDAFKIQKKWEKREVIVYNPLMEIFPTIDFKFEDERIATSTDVVISPVDVRFIFKIDKTISINTKTDTYTALYKTISEGTYEALLPVFTINVQV